MPETKFTTLVAKMRLQTASSDLLQRCFQSSEFILPKSTFYKYAEVVSDIEQKKKGSGAEQNRERKGKSE